LGGSHAELFLAMTSKASSVSTLSMTPSQAKLTSRLAYFFGFFCVALLVGFNTDQYVSRDAFYMTSSTAFAREGGNDKHRYADVANYFAGLLPTNPTTQFNTVNWTPGYPALVSLVLRLTGAGHYHVKMLLLTCALLALAFAFTAEKLPYPRNHGLRFLVWSSLFVLPNFRWWSFREGYLLSEPGTLVLFLFAWFYLVKAIEQRDRNSLIWAGLFLAGTAYFRAMCAVLVELTLYSAIGFLGLVTLLLLVLQKLYAPKSPKFESHLEAFKTALAGAAILFGVYFAATMPWKAYNFARVKAFAMGPNAKTAYDTQWAIDSEVPEFAHTDNSACHSDPAFCQVYRAGLPGTAAYAKPLTFFVFFTRPVQWLTFKIANFHWFWTGVSATFDRTAPLAWLFAQGEGVLYLVLAFLAFRRLKQRSKKFSALTEVGLWVWSAAFVLAHVAVFTIAHYESRYGWFLRMYFFWVFLYVYYRTSFDGKKKVPAL